MAAGMRAARGKIPPRWRRRRRRVTLRRIMEWGSHAAHGPFMRFRGRPHGRVLIVFGVLARVLVRHGGCEIGDGVVEGLHLDEKPVEFFQG